MKLIYRGVSYDYDPSQARSGNLGRPGRSTHGAKAPYTLMYRGVKIEVDPTAALTEAPVLPTSYNLSYRGVSYQVNRDAQGQVTSMTTLTKKPTKTTSNQPAFMMSTLPQQAVNKVHQANLLRDLQRRLEIAQERGDQRLVALLEAERQQIFA
jgi:YD repeat-containing protein